jgi:predicted NAD/FAD-binding protein
MTSRKRIGVIGSGISGLTAAHLLSREHEVVVFEANDYIGGHTHTVPVDIDNTKLNVDTGFIVCNDRNYPNFLKLLGQLEVDYQRTEMSFSVTNRALDLEYNGHNPNTLFAQRRNALRPKFIGMVRDIMRFNKRAKEALLEGSTADKTLDDFIHSLGLGDWFRNNYVLPMVAAIWSCSAQQAGDFPLQFFLRFFNHHGLLDIQNRPQWYVLKNGSHSYIKPLTKPFRDNIYLSTPVQSVARNAKGLIITSAKGAEKFDEVVFACHSNQALALLADPTAAETQVLGNLAYQDNDVVLHTDVRVMPKRKRAWAAWNFYLDHNGSDGTVTDKRGALPVVTYNMNILQGLVSSDPLLVTLNANHLIDPGKVIRTFNYAHPVYSLESSRAQAQRPLICGHNNTHYCGAYWYSGFHEDGVRSALDVARRFGIELEQG